MNGAVNPASIAISISIGGSLLAGFFSVWVAMRSRKGGAVMTVAILCGIALLLMMINAAAAAVIAIGGMAYLGLLEAALLLTAAFAVVGIVIGGMRGLRSGRAINTRSA